MVRCASRARRRVQHIMSFVIFRRRYGGKSLQERAEDESNDLARRVLGVG